MSDHNDKQTLVEYIASLSAKDKGLIVDLPLDIEKLLLLDTDDFDCLTNKQEPGLNKQQQDRRVEIIRRIGGLQGWEQVLQEGRKYLRDKDDDGNGRAKSKNKSESDKSKSESKSNKEEQEQEQKKKEKEHEERIMAIAKSISFKEWQTKLVKKYQNLHNVAQKNLPNLWHSLEFDLSIRNILHIKDCTLPFAGIVLGKPISLKTVGIEMFRKSRHTFYTDKFSSKSFVSHSTAIPKEDLVKIDLLPKIKNKCFLTPELAPVFAARDDDSNRNSWHID